MQQIIGLTFQYLPIVVRILEARYFDPHLNEVLEERPTALIIAEGRECARVCFM